jgi:(4S)-4-hydroxy-5-phosphonooxypentane-2,3-dione isomerase
MTDQELVPQTSWIVTVEFRIQSNCVAQFMKKLDVQASESLREPDCAQFDVCVDPSDVHRVFLYEVYANREAFAAHLESSHFKAFDTLTRPWISFKRVSEWQRTRPTVGHALEPLSRE